MRQKGPGDTPREQGMKETVTRRPRKHSHRRCSGSGIWNVVVRDKEADPFLSPVGRTGLGIIGEGVKWMSIGSSLRAQLCAVSQYLTLLWCSWGFSFILLHRGSEAPEVRKHAQMHTVVQLKCGLGSSAKLMCFLLPLDIP